MPQISIVVGPEAMRKVDGGLVSKLIKKIRLGPCQVRSKHLHVIRVPIAGSALALHHLFYVGARGAAAAAADGHAAVKADLEVVVTNRGVCADVLGDAGRLAGRVVENVAEDARRARLLGVLAGAAGKLQLVRLLVLLGVQHVGALGAEAKRDLLKLLALASCLALVRRRGLWCSHCVESMC